MKLLNINKSLLIIVIGSLTISISSCKKDWLDEKPDKSLVVPTTLEDFQALLDNANIMNVNYPVLGEAGTDNYYITNYSFWQSLSVKEQNAYRWEKDVFPAGVNINDWDNAYSRILKANIVIDGIGKIEQNGINEINWNNVKGSALFFRATNLFLSRSHLLTSTELIVVFLFHSALLQSTQPPVASLCQSCHSDFLSLMLWHH